MRATLLLATSVAAAVATPVCAAEKAPVPEAVRACPQHGAGFVQLPGTTTCIRISGRARSEYTTGTRRVSRDDIAGFGTTGQVSADVRSETPYGPLRGYVRVKAGTGTGPRD